MTVEQLLKEAKILSNEEKADLIDGLLASMDPVEQAEVDRAWAEEIERRIDAYDRGEITAEPVEDVIATLRQRLRKGPKPK